MGHCRPDIHKNKSKFLASMRSDCNSFSAHRNEFLVNRLLNTHNDRWFWYEQVISNDQSIKYIRMRYVFLLFLRIFNGYCFSRMVDMGRLTLSERTWFVMLLRIYHAYFSYEIIIIKIIKALYPNTENETIIPYET